MPGLMAIRLPDLVYGTRNIQNIFFRIVFLASTSIIFYPGRIIMVNEPKARPTSIPRCRITRIPSSMSRADTFKVGGGQLQHSETNGACTAIPAYIPVAAGPGTKMSLKLPSPSRVPARPSPFTTHSYWPAALKPLVDHLNGGNVGGGENVHNRVFHDSFFDPNLRRNFDHNLSQSWGRSWGMKLELGLKSCIAARLHAPTFAPTSAPTRASTSANLRFRCPSSRSGYASLPQLRS
ncbi:hypothetical protein B0H16DRAFT_1469217 [Mycena metata]|uniref:Uncharacterized protein n=1 Tax=Mycena metata TaxID=1033252 RepID=A0AAD7HYS2_9AGAR|nr:hypothetical protein B0H16DRAFT_1469217 [Mycena metata]